MNNQNNLPRMGSPVKRKLLKLNAKKMKNIEKNINKLEKEINNLERKNKVLKGERVKLYKIPTGVKQVKRY